MAAAVVEAVGTGIDASKRVEDAVTVEDSATVCSSGGGEGAGGNST